MDDAEFRKFLAGFEACQQRLGGGKVALNPERLLALIRDHRAAAERFVELHCASASLNPGVLQPAAVVAEIFEHAFGDRRLIEDVRATAAKLRVQIPGVEVVSDPSAVRDEVRVTQRREAAAREARPSVAPTASVPNGTVTSLAQALDGAAPLAAVQAWVTRTKADYTRPDVARLIAEVGADHVLDVMEAWKRRSQSAATQVNTALQEALAMADAHPEAAVERLARIREVARLLGSSNALALSTFWLGYRLWRLRRDTDAADLLEEAARLIGDSDAELGGAARSYRVDALIRSQQDAVAEEAVEEYIAYGTTTHQPGHVASGVRDRARLLARRGEVARALVESRHAVELRRALSQDDAKAASTVSLAAFLHDLGRIARQAGDFGQAVNAFTELATEERRAADLGAHARALSEIGLTWAQAGETERARGYLERASDIGARVGQTDDAQRWRDQAATLAGAPPPGATRPGPAITGELTTEAEARQVMVAAEVRYVQKDLQGAIDAAERVLAWSIRQPKGGELELNARSMVGIASMALGDEGRGIAELREVYRLAEWRWGGPRVLIATMNLARAYLMTRQFNEAHEVLTGGVALAMRLLAEHASVSARKELVAVASELFELRAFVDCVAEGRAPEFLAFSEASRTLILGSWLAMLRAVDDARLSVDARTELFATLAEMRDASVQIEERMLDGRRDPTQVHDLETRWRAAHVATDTALRAVGIDPDALRAAPNDPHADVKEHLRKVVAPGTCLLVTYSIPEGICVATFTREGADVRGEAGIVTWERNERLQQLPVGVHPEAAGAVFLGGAHAVAERLRGRVGPALSGARRVLVIPHRELALMPWWWIVDEVAGIEELAIAPSLRILRNCISATVPGGGDALLIGDATGTLRHASTELGTLRARWGTGAVVEVASRPALLAAAPRAELLHVAAHGSYCATNPYRSGFALPDGDTMTVGAILGGLTLAGNRLSVLASCESGIPEIHPSNELTGLPSALLAVGARSVLASSWPVHDGATALLLREFYTAWEGTGGTRGPGAALTWARARLANLSRAEAAAFLGSDDSLPPGQRPFDDERYTNSFQLHGAP